MTTQTFGNEQNFSFLCYLLSSWSVYSGIGRLAIVLTLFLAEVGGGALEAPFLRFFVRHCQMAGDSELKLSDFKRGTHCRPSVKFLEPGQARSADSP